MTWWILVLFFSTVQTPHVIGVYPTERACIQAFDRTEQAQGVDAFDCIEIKP